MTFLSCCAALRCAAQFPVFLTSMWSIRLMSLSGWEGFSTGGLAWFHDLTLPAMDLAAFTAPMGGWAGGGGAGVGRASRRENGSSRLSAKLGC